LDVAYFEAEDPLMEERDRVQGLVPGRCCDAAFEREVAQECGNLRGVHRAGMTLAVEQDVAPDPVDVGLLGLQAHVPNADLGANPLEQARTPRARRRQPRADAAGSRGSRLAGRRSRRRMRGSGRRARCRTSTIVHTRPRGRRLPSTRGVQPVQMAVRYHLGMGTELET
jgi:hypothetical protein